MVRLVRSQPLLLMLPDAYIKKMKQGMAEAEAMVESESPYEPDSDFSSPPDDDT